MTNRNGGWTVERCENGWTASHPQKGFVEVKTRARAREYIRAYKRGEAQEIGDEAKSVIARMRHAVPNL